ncbi:MAG: hypothetical protein ACRDKW_08290 [Actinomycetota bacterium]
MSGSSLEQRVARAAESALAERRYVSAIDVLAGLGWLAPTHLQQWRQGRVESLEQVVPVNPHKLSAAMRLFRAWCTSRGLAPSETTYVARTPDRKPLRFSVSGAAGIERAYRTHWVSPEVSEAERRRLAERQGRPPDLVVVWPLKEWTCTACTGTGDLLLMRDENPVCLPCAGLGHLVYLAAGDAALTRRAHRASGLSAVVVRFSRSRKRYERQGLLVEPQALRRAEELVAPAPVEPPARGDRAGSERARAGDVIP